MSRLFFTWDDGHPDDLFLKDLHEKYAIPCMLFVPACNNEGRRVMAPEEIKMVVSDRVEIGAHTYHHEYLTRLAPQAARAELADGKNYLEDIIGAPVEHFCFPGGAYNEAIKRDALGIYKTARTAKTMRVAHPYPLVDTTFHFYCRGWRSIFFNSIRNRSPSIFLLAAVNVYKISYFDFIKKYIHWSFYNCRNDDVILWGHSWELRENGLFGILEDLFRFITSNGIKCEKYSDIAPNKCNL